MNFQDINSGSSQDWAKGQMGIKYSYTMGYYYNIFLKINLIKMKLILYSMNLFLFIELRPGQGTVDQLYGFSLPENRLPNLTKETFAGIKAALLKIG